MKRLYGTWYDKAFWVWGESVNNHHRHNGQRARLAEDRPLYGLGPGQLARTLQVVGLASQRGKSAEMVLWMPTLGTDLISADQVAAYRLADMKEIELTPYAVNAIPLELEAVLRLLYRCKVGQVLAPQVLASRALTYWAEVTRFALVLVAKQRFLPDIKEDDSSYQAVWSVMPVGSDRARLNRLVAAMPGVSLALSTDAMQAPHPHRENVLVSFIEAVVDHIVRRAAKTKGVASINKTRDRANIHRQWVTSLCQESGKLQGNPAELAALALDVSRWKYPLTLTEAAPFQLCFRVEEPIVEGDDEEIIVPPSGTKWFVRYLAQSKADPSLQIRASDIWQGSIPSFLGDAEYIQECLLVALASAAKIVPEVTTNLASPTPEGFLIDTTGLHDFLTKQASQLEQAGFRVMLPTWWVRGEGQVRLKARAKVTSLDVPSSGGVGLEELVDVDWQLVLGEEELSIEELEMLARLKTPLVKLRGQWVELRKQDIESAQTLLKRAHRQLTARDFVHLALSGKAPTNDLDLEGVEAEGWIGDVVGQLTDKESFQVIPEPAGFCGSLRPYQKRGYSWLAFMCRFGFGACLADDMGLGKTIQILALIQADWARGVKRPVLIVCPTSVMGGWQREAARFTPQLPAALHHGPQRMMGEDFVRQCEQQAIVVTSYALLARDLDDLNQIQWQGVVLDEAQNIKNPETKQAQAARQLSADYRVALTGTPVENHVGDLWSIMEFLNPGWLGTETEYRRQFLVPIQRYQDLKAGKHLKRLTSPFILRRTKTDKTIISDLPEKIETKEFCILTREQASLYKAVTDEMMELIEEAEDMQRRGLIVSALTKLKQICNHPALFLGDHSRIPGRSGKLTRLTEMLEEILAIGDRALVFTQYAQMGHLLKAYLEEIFGREVLFLHGGVPKRQRDIMIDRFQNEPHAPFVFILSLRAGGTGLTLTRANHVFHFDRWWNPAVENQATDRAYRIGQKRNVQVHKFVCAGTVEEKIDQLIEQKEELASQVVSDGESYLTELSTEKLRELMQLQEMVSEDE